MTTLSALYRKLPLDPLVTRNIYLYRLVRALVKRFDIFLPHEPDFAAFQFLSPTSGLFLDIGANDGLAARSFRKFNKTTPILALEPNRCHQASLERCKKGDPLFSYQLLGAGERSASMTLFTPVYKRVSLTSYTSFSPAEARQNLARFLHIPHIGRKVSFIQTEANLVALDDLSLKPDFVKIDVEGFEVAVLKGMMQTLEAWRPILMIEVQPHNLEKVRSLLHPLAYEAVAYDPQAQVFLRRYQTEPLNLFFLPPARLPDGRIY